MRYALLMVVVIAGLVFMAMGSEATWRAAQSHRQRGPCDLLCELAVSHRRKGRSGARPGAGQAAREYFNEHEPPS